MALSGKDGKIVLGASDLAAIRNWRFTPSANVPQFAHSGSAGHKVSVKGTLSGSLSFDVIYDKTDPIEERLKPGDSVTLLLHLDTNNKFSVPSRMESIEYNVDIDDGGEITAACTASANGAWTYPGGTVSS